ncbi:DBF4-type zinc finger-containing protein 2 [Pelodytes ibericus]
MFDKRKSSDEGSSPLPPGLERKETEEDYMKMESSSSGDVQIQEQSGSCLTPGHYRQGYCSCCQVHYINLEKHLASDQHKQTLGCNRSRFNSSILMERFLKDVHLYHPQNYQDARPTYDDIPEVILLPTSPEQCSTSLLHLQKPEKEPAGREMYPENDQYSYKSCTFSTFTSKYNSKKQTFKQPYNDELKTGQSGTDGQSQQHGTSNTILTTGQNALITSANSIPHSSPYKTLYSCTQPTAKNIYSEAPHPVLNKGTNKNTIPETKTCGMINKCPYPDVASRGLQNSPLTYQGSYMDLTSVVSCKKQGGIKSQGAIDSILRNHVVDRHFKNSKLNKERGVCLYEEGKCTVNEVIEEVILKNCYGISSRTSEGKEEDSVSSLNVHSIIGHTVGSSLSFDWDVPVQCDDSHSKPKVLKNLDTLKEISVDLDEDYRSKLKSVLDACPIKETIEDLKAESEEEVILALPHVPPSFVGKTWSQVKYEDDLKIEALVKQFRKGRFHCYFENGKPDRKSKRRLKSEEIERKIELETNDWKVLEDIHTLPIFNDMPCGDNDSDIPSIKSEKVLRTELNKPGRRTWRLASRCQIVKVSHGTQTSLVNYPVVKKKYNKSEIGQCSEQGIVYDFEEERTPDMKTRMCALKLPESYTKILTPLQPKTMVYVLSHPDVKLCTSKPVCISKRGRNQYSTDSRDSVNYKYKQSPLKYYDPLTNRILKTPPRNSLRGLGAKRPCVRKLFKSLSSDSNVDKLDLEPKESTTSKKSFSSCSATSLCFDSIKGKDVNSSLRGSGSSVGTEFPERLKAEHIEKPFAQFSISPFNANPNQSKDDIQLTSTRSKKKTIWPKQADPRKKKNIKSSKRMIKAGTEIKHCTISKYNQHGMVHTIEKVAKTSQTRKQPLRKSSLNFLKATVSSVPAHQPRQKKRTTGQKNELPTRQHNSITCIKSQPVLRKPSKRKSNICKAALKTTRQSRLVRKQYQNTVDSNSNKTRSKASKRIVPESLPLIVSKPRARTQTSRTKVKSNSTTRRRVR